jgi:hypothetical protein
LNTGESWVGLVFLAIFVAPLIALAQLLTGIGLLRVLFNLQPPLGTRAPVASPARVPAQSAEPGPSVTSPPAPGAPRERTPPPAPAPMPTSPQEIGAQLAADVRGNRMLRVTETVERGLAADAKFFAGHPDDTLALAKRLVAVERADLALRILQPYLVSHRSHRQHLTNALLVASLLARDPSRLADAARFLKQVKALYPREPMVDQLIKSTDKAIAATPAK